MGLNTWTAEEPRAEEEEQPGAEEVALERKKQFEPVCPQMLEVGEMLVAPVLEALIPASPVYATKSGAKLHSRPWLQGAESSFGRSKDQKAIILVPHDFPLDGAKRIRSKRVAGRPHGQRSGGEIEAGCHRGSVRKPLLVLSC